MEDKLQFWTMKDWLTIYQATMLACGEDPSLDEIGNTTTGIPVGYDAFHQALIDDVKKDSTNWFLEEDDPDVIFNNIKNDHNRIRSDIRLDTQLQVTDIKRWLSKKGKKPAFFFPEEIDKPHIEVNVGYQTRLMTIMYTVINRYYADNYDPDNRDTVPKQVDVIEWLVTNYSLSDVEAKAIDKLTRPERSKSPKG